MKTKNGFIVELDENDIFVFGSNWQGHHGAGAARTAQDHFGARRGVGEGLTGKCYALPTVKTVRPYVTESLKNLPRIIQTFADTVNANPHLTFYLTNVGCGLAGFKDSQIAPLFLPYENVSNLLFPPQWKKWFSRCWE